MDEVMKWLMNYCLDHKIGVEYRNDLRDDAPSVCYQNPSFIIFNDNFAENEKPFMLAHEIGHITNGSPDCQKLINGNKQEENVANRFAINLLWKYCLENDIWFETIYQFAQAFGVPPQYWYLLSNPDESPYNIAK